MKKLPGSPSTPLLSLKVILNLIHINQLPWNSQNPSSGWCWSRLFNPSIQGHRELRAESYCLLLPKYENYGLFNPTGGSPDVVHLIKEPSEVF